MMANMNIRDVADNLVHRAVDIGAHFAAQYPDRVGIRDCVIYGRKDEPAFIAYRTRAGTIVVRGSEKP